jgi:hypothetical protein
MLRSNLLDNFSLILRQHAMKAYHEGKVLRTEEFIWQRLVGTRAKKGNECISPANILLALIVCSQF